MRRIPADLLDALARAKVPVKHLPPGKAEGAGDPFRMRTKIKKPHGIRGLAPILNPAPGEIHRGILAVRRARKDYQHMSKRKRAALVTANAALDVTRSR